MQLQQVQRQIVRQQLEQIYQVQLIIIEFIRKLELLIQMRICLIW